MNRDFVRSLTVFTFCGSITYLLNPNVPRRHASNGALFLLSGGNDLTQFSLDEKASVAVRVLLHFPIVRVSFSGRSPAKFFPNIVVER
jgi:hypothetical protein